MLTVGSLFAGIGGFDLGLERAGMRSVWQCEIDPYAQRVLAKHWPDVLRVPDIRDVGAGTVPYVDVICGGFPCQDLSYAGKGAGLAGARSGLWHEYVRVIDELRPRYVVVENVRALVTRGLDVVLGTLATLGYDAEWDCIPASAIGAPHRRDRVWIVAYPSGGHEPPEHASHAVEPGERPAKRWGPELTPRPGAGRGARGRDLAAGTGGRGARGPAGGDAAADPHTDSTRRGELPEHDGEPFELGRRPPWGHADGLRDEVADADRGGRDGRPGQLRESGRREPQDRGGEQTGAWPADFWAAEPPVGRVVDGFPGRVDRVRALGNSLVPQIAELVGRRILAYESGLT